MSEIASSQYIYILNDPDNIISVFDELRYDRSDIDILSPTMRKHVIQKLEKSGFKQISGNILENKQTDTRCLFPKFHTLGSSPFDISHYISKRIQDYYVLTPTQTACQFINHYNFDDALEKICLLIEKQPINVFKLLDYLEQKDSHQDFLKAITFLRDKQKSLIETEPLCHMRSLG